MAHFYLTFNSALLFHFGKNIRIFVIKDNKLTLLAWLHC